MRFPERSLDDATGLPAQTFEALEVESSYQVPSFATDFIGVVAEKQPGTCPNPRTPHRKSGRRMSLGGDWEQVEQLCQRTCRDPTETAGIPLPSHTFRDKIRGFILSQPRTRPDGRDRKP